MKIFIVIIVIILFFAYIIWAINTFFNEIFYYKNEKSMFERLENILITHYKDNDYALCYQEIELLFDYVINKDTELKRYYNSVAVLLGKYLIRINKNYKLISTLKIDSIAEYKKYILNMIEDYTQKNPINIVEGADNMLLQQLIDYRKQNDIVKFNKTIDLLAQDIKRLQDTVYEKNKSALKQNIIGVVGIILSIFFGIISLIQYFGTR